MKNKVALTAVILGLAYGFASCGAPEPKVEEVQEEMHEHEDHEGHDHEEMMEEAADADFLAVPEGASVFFANLEDGQTVSSPVKIEFGIEGMTVEPAGELHEGMGHHHIIINGSAIERGMAVPADSVNIHFGGGQTETELALPAGEHTLTMQFADGYHQSYGPQMAASIKVIVE